MAYHIFRLKSEIMVIGLLKHEMIWKFGSLKFSVSMDFKFE